MTLNLFKPASWVPPVQIAAPVIPEVKLNGRLLKEGDDYIIDYAKGMLLFRRTPSRRDKIEITPRRST